MPQHILSNIIKDSILKALEKDGTWLERYNATNELHVTSNALKEAPDNCNDVCLDDIRRVMELVLEVRYLLVR